MPSTKMHRGARSLDRSRRMCSDLLRALLPAPVCVGRWRDELPWHFPSACISMLPVPDDTNRERTAVHRSWCQTALGDWADVCVLPLFSSLRPPLLASRLLGFAVGFTSRLLPAMYQQKATPHGTKARADQPRLATRQTKSFPPASPATRPPR
jgi:hypothetical protein